MLKYHYSVKLCRPLQKLKGFYLVHCHELDLASYTMGIEGIIKEIRFYEAYNN